MIIAFYSGGNSSILSWLIRWWTRGPFSHCEVVLSQDGEMSECASCSSRDGGMRIKMINLAPERWKLIDVIADVQGVRAWFEQRLGTKYDYLGLFSFVLPFKLGSGSRYWCSEAVAEALGLPDPWRYHPNNLHAELRSLILRQSVSSD